MAKKLTTASKDKNPLAQAFGLLVQKVRKKEKKTSGELGNDLGISDSLLRLIESGAATLQPDKSIELIKSLPSTPIEFRQLCVLLVVCAISERLWSDEENRPLAISDLVELDRGLGIAIQPLAKVWADLRAESDSKRSAKIIEELAVPERVTEFLAQKTDPAPDLVTPLAERWGRRLVEGTLPIHLDLVETIVPDLLLSFFRHAGLSVKRLT